jgi:hypothetical protein
MRRSALWLVVVLLVLPVYADNTLVTFQGGIGVIPVSRVDGAGSPGLAVRNVVLGVNPGGQPWVISKLNATVGEDGRIEVVGRGLLLAGGNGIGTNGGQSVRANLFCGAVSHTSNLVPLDVNGDFHIDGMLTPMPPLSCDSPLLLIVNQGGAWFAAGIPKS